MLELSKIIPLPTALRWVGKPTGPKWEGRVTGLKWGPSGVLRGLKLLKVPLRRKRFRFNIIGYVSRKSKKGGEIMEEKRGSQRFANGVGGPNGVSRCSKFRLGVLSFASV